MSCRFAGARNLQEYWRLVREGSSAFSPVPRERWDSRAFRRDDLRASDGSYSEVGAFLDEIDTFPALALQIPPRRVEVMDPQHRLSLECALEAIEDSGRTTKDLPRRTAVYLGLCATEYRTLAAGRSLMQMAAAGDLGRAPGDPSDLAAAVERILPARPYSAPGALANMAAATIAQECGFHGPAYTVDAACASALVALEHAVHQLRLGQVDAALAGGVYLQITPEHYVAFSQVGALSRRGQCLPFDARADGFLQGDGVGIVVLKRMADALRDGDRVYAVLRGIASNSDGQGDGPMTPSSAGQAEVIRMAFADAGLTPAAAGYIEAHGTATLVGDRVELEGLGQAVGQPSRPIFIGSCKANVGHTMSAAGIAGLIRAALAVHHGTIPPTAGFSSPNQALAGPVPFVVPRAPLPWTETDRVAGVSAFGFGGTNVHAVLGAAPVPAAGPEQAELVLMSAYDVASLRALAGRTATALAADAGATVAGVARAWASREAGPARLSLVAASRDELVAQLEAVGRGEEPPGTAALELRDGDAPAPRIAFLFPGQGSQRLGMLSGIAERFPIVRETIDRLGESLDGVLPLPLRHLIQPEHRRPAVTEAEAAGDLLKTSNCQPAIVACGLALARLLRQVGIEPTVVAGHSVGEFTAAAVAGALSEEAVVRLVARRGQAMEVALAGVSGGMLALGADLAAAEALLGGREGLAIANLNHDRQVVVAGELPALADLAARAREAGIAAVTLRTSHAFHSPAMQAVDMEPLLAQVSVEAPALPFASAMTDAPYDSAASLRAALASHAATPVNFPRAVAQCAELKADLYLEVAAGGPLVSFVRRSSPRPALALADRNDADGGRSLLATLGKLWTLGAPVDVRPVLAGASLASVPPRVLPRERYWVVSRTEAHRPGLRAGRGDVEPTAVAAVAVTTVTSALAAPADLVSAKVIELVARASAYPASAVKPEMELMGDLGFDSLMLTELVSLMDAAFPAAGRLPPGLISRGTKVIDVVQHIRSGATAAPTGESEAPLARWQPVWRPALAPAGAAPVRPGSILVVSPEGASLAPPPALAALGGAVQALAPEAAQRAAGCGLLVWVVREGAALASEDPAEELLAVLAAQARQGARPDLLVVRQGEGAAGEALAGVVRALAREWPAATAKVVVFPEDAPLSWIFERLAVEYASADRAPDVKLTQEGRFTVELEPAPAPERRPVSAADTVLVTGGTRGIGLAVARALVERGVRVLLLGRGPASPEAQALARSTLVKLGQADVTDRTQLRAAVSGVGWEITHLVHAAGVLADGPIEAVDAEAGRQCRRVKGVGFRNALEACGGSLRRAVAIGSWAGRFGNRHQLHYASANAFLAGLCQADARCVASELGVWSSSAMASTIPENVRASMRAAGVDFLTDDEGVRALLTALEAQGGPRVVVEARRRPVIRRAEVALTLSPDTERYLRDHVIEGAPVLPFAAAVDLLALAAAVRPPFALTDITAHQRVEVTGPTPVRARVEGREVELLIGDRTAYRARLGEVQPIPVSRTVGHGQPPTVSVAEFYRRGTFHGPRMAAVTAVETVGPTSVVGRVKAGVPGELIAGGLRGAFTVDFLALDGAFQLGAFAAWSEGRPAGLPVQLRRYVQLRQAPPPGSELTAEFRLVRADAHTAEADLLLWDASGELVAAAEGLTIALEERRPDHFQVRPEHTDPALWDSSKDLKMRLQSLQIYGIRNPYFREHDGTARDTTSINGREILNFDTYNYLGYSGDPRVIADVVRALETYGTSVSASRVASGQRPLHRDLERALADGLEVDDALVFTAGHATNVSAIGRVMTAEDLVLHDELAHDSILAGIKLSGASRRPFRHGDVRQLASILAEVRGRYQKVLIAVEGVYSMDGDICDLPAFIDLKRRYGCLLMVDEAHSFGVLGPRGLGVREHFGVAGGDVDLWMGTLSKSLASCGGWIAGSQAMIELLRYSAGGFVYSAGMTPANTQAALSALRLMAAEPERVARLQENARTFHRLCRERGLDTGNATGATAIVPIIIANSGETLMLAQRLYDAGVNVSPIVHPAVAEDATRLRFFVSALHQPEQLERAAATIAAKWREVKNELQRRRQLFGGRKAVAS
jgi:8-amino-7-oxononanoate synthase